MTYYFAMERAGTVIARWKNSSDCVAPDSLGRAAWRVAAGEKIASHTVGVSLVGKRLLIQVEDDVWQRHLRSLRPQILANLEKKLGKGIVTGLDFRVAPRRMGPGTELEPRRPAPAVVAATAGATGADDAELIEDPVLRANYRRSRRRASA